MLGLFDCRLGSELSKTGVPASTASGPPWHGTESRSNKHGSVGVIPVSCSLFKDAEENCILKGERSDTILNLNTTSKLVSFRHLAEAGRYVYLT